jgi:uncharacterized protein YndB with AHSA1/START domain
MNDPTHMAAADQQVLITRIFEAPREQVFKAWTDPDQVAAWYGPEHFDTRGQAARADGAYQCADGRSCFPGTVNACRRCQYVHRVGQHRGAVSGRIGRCRHGQLHPQY